jgi:hypothetical protein
MNAYRAADVSVHPSVRLYLGIVELENSWMVLDEIWCGRYVTADYPKTVFSVFYVR